MPELNEQQHLIVRLLDLLKIRRSILVLASPAPVAFPPEARPFPERPYYRYTFADGTHGDVDALYDEAHRRRQLAEIIRLEAGNIERGMRFGDDKPPRRRSYLYRHAEAVLRERGISASAKAVMNELVKRRVIVVKARRNGDLLLTWRDDARRHGRIEFKQFEKRISEVRKALSR